MRQRPETRRQIGPPTQFLRGIRPMVQRGPVPFLPRDAVGPSVLRATPIMAAAERPAMVSLRVGLLRRRAARPMPSGLPRDVSRSRVAGDVDPPH